MRLIDTHSHIYSKEFSRDRVEMMQRALGEGVEKIYLPAIDSESRAALLAVEAEYPGVCFGMAGLHPCSVKEDYREELRVVEEDLKQRAGGGEGSAVRSWAAVGEIGLDFYWDKTFMAQQYEAFHQQIAWAMQYDLPIVIHSRNAMNETIGVVKEHAGVRGIFHCFSGDAVAARQIVDLGFYLGIGGVVTYKNSGLGDAIKDIGLEHLVLETDAPYLAPVPFRGKRNESSYLRYVVEKLAEVMGVTGDEVAEVTTRNAQKIFGR